MIELTPLEPKTDKSPDPAHVLNMLQNCRKAMGTPNEWGTKSVAKWVDYAEALAKEDTSFISEAAKLGIEIS